MATTRLAADWSVYLVTDAALCAELGVPGTVAAALRGGVTAVQLRDPGCADEEFVALGRVLAAQLAGTGVRLILDDRVHLVVPVGADGVHVGQGDTPVPAARAAIGPDRLLGLSVQAVGHVEQARAQRLDVDYLGVGPVFAQTTKPDADAPHGLGTLARIVAASPWPCVAIGGMTGARAAAVRAAGAVGVAVVSAICGRPDPEAAAREVRRAWDGAEAAR